MTLGHGRRPRQRPLRWLLALHPRAFRRRFALEILAVHRQLASDDRRAARRLLWDLARNLPATYYDHLRLRRHRRNTLDASIRRPRSKETTMLDILGQDLRFASRRLLHRPAVTLVAMTTLALGIGGTTSIYSVIRGVLLHPLSAPHAERLLAIGELGHRGPARVSYENYLDYRRQSATLEHIALARPQSVNVTGLEQPERIRGMFVTASFFDALEAHPILGRAIREGEDTPGGERTTVLAYDYWQSRFGARSDILGRALLLNNEPHTIVGVLGPEFRFPLDDTDAFISLQTAPGELNRANSSFFAFGRLASGASAEQADKEISLISERLAAQYPEANRDTTASLTPLRQTIISSSTDQLLAILMSAVVMLLLIAIANVANLQLAQATGRSPEMVLRSAIGAARARIATQLMIENLALALGAGLLGIGVAFGAIRLLTRFGPSVFQVGIFDIAPDAAVLGFAIGVSLLSGVAFGVVPARRASRVDLLSGLCEGGSGRGAGRDRGRFRMALVVAQTALAVLLAIGSGLLLRSLANLSQVDVGFDTERLLTVQFRLPENKYQTPESITNFFDRMLERVAAVPGVESVASAFGMPFTGDESSVTVLADGADPDADVQLPTVRANAVSPNYFAAMRIPLVAGRSLEGGDTSGSPFVAVVSQRAAEAIWPGQDPLGKTFTFRGSELRFHVVGVCGDIYNRGLHLGLDPMVYASYRQVPRRFATIAARTSTPDPHALADPIRNAIWEIDPDQPLWEVMTQKERIATWTGGERFMTSMVAIFTVIAMALAAVGIGGVLAYSVALRRRELGVRLSLGASRAQILGLMLTQGMRLVALGVAIGLLGALGLGSLLSSVLFGVSGIDTQVFVLAPLLLAAVALLATLLPSIAAARIDPVRTLRNP